MALLNKIGKDWIGRSLLPKVGIAIAAVGLALGLKLGLNPFWEIESPFLLFLAAVMASALYGGASAGIWATIFAALLSDYLFLTPIYTFFGASPGQNLRLLLFIFEGILISNTIASLQCSKQWLRAGERALHQSENRYRCLVDSIGDYGIFLLDPDGQVNSWNPGAEKLYGYPTAAIVGRHFSCFYLELEVQQDRPAQDLQLARSSGRNEMEGWQVRQDGSRFWAHRVMMALRDEWGQLQGFAQVTRDLTETRQTQALLADANTQLERRVEERTAELARANRQLQQEIADRQQVEAVLRERERRFQAIFNHTFQFTGLLLPDGTLVEANQSMLDFGGLERSEVVGRPFWEIHWWTQTPATQERLRQAIATAATGEFVRYEVEVLGAADQVVTLDFSLKPIRDENHQVVLLIPEGRDITALKQAERTLRSFFDSTPMMMGIVELGQNDVRHLADNALTARLFGCTPEQMRDRWASELGVAPEPLQLWIQHYREAQATQAPVRFEYPHPSPQGQRWLSATVNLISPPGDRPPRFAYIVEDISDRKRIEVEQQQAEQEIRRLNAKLEQRVLERTQQLATANRQLAGEVAERERALADLRQTEDALRQSLEREQAARSQAEAANRLKDEFLATLSHELRTPLNAILGWTQLLQTRTLEAATQARALQTISRNSKSLAQLIEDLLDVSRIITGKFHLQVEPVNLMAIIQEAIETVRPAAQAKQISLEFSAVQPPEQVLGDAVRLQQIVWNLLANAVKFTGVGGRVAVALAWVEADSQSLIPPETSRSQAEDFPVPPRLIQIQVQDTGQGIAAEILPYIFDRFRQGDSSSTRSHGGLGLGLAIVRHLVELHGGSVEAASPGPGQGATFTVTLPVPASCPRPGFSTALPSLTPSPSPTDPSCLAGLQILVVEDEADTRQLLTTILEFYGAKAIAVATAPEALELLQHTRLDLLVSDIGLPDIDGYTLMHRVRTLAPEQGGQIPALALTAFAADIDRERALGAGFQRYLAKPVEPDTLAMVIADLTDRGQRSAPQGSQNS